MVGPSPGRASCVFSRRAMMRLRVYASTHHLDGSQNEENRIIIRCLLSRRLTPHLLCFADLQSGLPSPPGFLFSFHVSLAIPPFPSSSIPALSSSSAQKPHSQMALTPASEFQTTRSESLALPSAATRYHTTPRCLLQHSQQSSHRQFSSPLTNIPQHTSKTPPCWEASRFFRSAILYFLSALLFGRTLRSIVTCYFLLTSFP